MTPKKLKFKYLSMYEMLQDMSYLMNMGFCEYKINPKTGKDEFQFTESGLQFIKTQEKVFSGHN